MDSESSNEPRSTAIEQLQSFGLSAYAARTFVALVSLGDGTAQDVSDVSKVPRTRVYDAVDELRDHGLVDVQHSTPKRFTPISTETAGRHFHQDIAHRIDVLTDALENVEPIVQTTQQRGVWTVTGRETVSERVVTFFEEATDEVVYMTVEELLTQKCIDALRAASERGVTIRLAGMSPAVEEEIQQTIPEAELFDSLWEWSDMPAGRLLMVDQEKTLVGVLVSDDDERSPELRDETAIWGTGETNSLVVVLKALFTWQLDGKRSNKP